MESMGFDILILFLTGTGMIIAFMKNRDMDSLLVKARDSKERDKREE
jgi:hypothetical protein